MTVLFEWWEFYFIAAARIAQIIAHSGQSVLPFLLHLGGHDSHEGKEILKKIFFEHITRLHKFYSQLFARLTSSQRLYERNTRQSCAVKEAWLP